MDGGEAEAYAPRVWRAVMAVVRATPESVFQRIGFLVVRSLSPRDAQPATSRASLPSRVRVPPDARRRGVSV
jgi:hypothetical protein